MKKYTLTLASEPFEADGVEYSVRQMSGFLRDSYDVELFNRMEKDGDTMVLKSPKGMKMNLLTKCIFDSKGQLVREDVMQNWPGDMLEELHTIAARLNKIALNKDDKKRMESETKNESKGSGEIGTS